MNTQSSKECFYQWLRNNCNWWTPERLDYYLRKHFKGVSLDGKNILEVGAGHGLFSIWCATQGAGNVVALEPESDGSTKNIHHQFDNISKAVDLGSRVKYINSTLQEFIDINKDTKFDCILMHAVVNHLDEESTRKLHLPNSDKERNRYVEIFRTMHNVLKTGGLVTLYDVGRYNFWNQVGITNPFASTIEYEKHQQPGTWKSLLQSSGFVFVDSIWLPPFKLRKFNVFLGSCVASYFIDSAYILRVKKP